MKYSQELKKRARWYARDRGFSWRVDETHMKVKGKWKYLYRAIDKNGDTIDFWMKCKNMNEVQFFNSLFDVYAA